MTKLEQIAEALQTLRPSAEWILHGDNYEEIQWLDKVQSQPSWSEVEAEMRNPSPKSQISIADKLASVGLDLDDLKLALGL